MKPLTVADAIAALQAAVETDPARAGWQLSAPTGSMAWGEPESGLVVGFEFDGGMAYVDAWSRETVAAQQRRDVEVAMAHAEGWREIAAQGLGDTVDYRAVAEALAAEVRRLEKSEKGA